MSSGMNSMRMAVLQGIALFDAIEIGAGVSGCTVARKDTVMELLNIKSRDFPKSLRKMDKNGRNILSTIADRQKRGFLLK